MKIYNHFCITHISRKDFTNLLEIFSWYDNGNWTFPNWLIIWGKRLGYL